MKRFLPLSCAIVLAACGRADDPAKVTAAEQTMLERASAMAASAEASADPSANASGDQSN